MKSTRTIKTEVVSSEPGLIVFKLQQEYTPKPVPIAKKVNSLVSLRLDGEGRVKYHKVRWLQSSGRGEGVLIVIGYVE